MKGIRVEPAAGVKTLFVDVVCDCGRNVLVDEKTREMSVKHPVPLTAGEKTVLRCDCGKRYLIRSQRGHFHVLDI